MISTPITVGRTPRGLVAGNVLAVNEHTRLQGSSGTSRISSPASVTVVVMSNPSTSDTDSGANTVTFDDGRGSGDGVGKEKER